MASSRIDDGRPRMLRGANRQLRNSDIRWHLAGATYNEPDAPDHQPMTDRGGSPAGTVLLAELADRIGLTAARWLSSSASRAAGSEQLLAQRGGGIGAPAPAAKRPTNSRVTARKRSASRTPLMGWPLGQKRAGSGTV